MPSSARGRLPIREEDGAILRTEVEFRSAGAESGRSLRVTTMYEPDPVLTLLVPVRMTEVYEAAVAADLGSAFAARTSSQPKPAGDRLDARQATPASTAWARHRERGPAG